eukprot:14606-Heterococcus_DN1.PRE.3
MTYVYMHIRLVADDVYVNGEYYGQQQQQEQPQQSSSSGSTNNAGTNGLFGSTRQTNDGSSCIDDSDSSNSSMSQGNGPIGLLRRLFGRGNNRQ